MIVTRCAWIFILTNLYVMNTNKFSITVSHKTAVQLTTKNCRKLGQAILDSQ